jgi:tetratricopeptide (TPR) repeat protein
MALRGIVPALLLAVLMLLAFSGVSGNDFVPYDDDLYVTRNPAVQAGLTADGLAWAFTSIGYAANWHPLTWVSHMSDVQLFGLDARRHHQMNLAIFLAGCLVLFHVLTSATGARWRSFFASALFAVHPLRAESVAWLAERKDVLSFFFGLLTIAFWLAWLRRPRWRAAYAAAVLCFIAALLAKSALIVLPPAMLLLAWWPLGAWHVHPGGSPYRRGAPAIAGAAWLLVPAVAVSIVAFLAQRAGGGLLAQAAPPFGMRLANALISPAAYLGKILLPRNLADFYPFPTAIAPGAVLAASLLLAGISTVVWRLRRSHPSAAAGWAWYLATLIPTLGLIPLGGQAMADRYTLIPSLGLAVAIVWLCAEAVSAQPFARMTSIICGATLLLVLTEVTRAQVATWRDGTTLFTHALRVTRDNWHIEHEYGALLLNAGRSDEATTHLRETLRLQPDHVLARYNLAGLLFRQGQAARAAEEYREVVRLRPDFAEAHFRLARSLAVAGRWEEALPGYAEALRLAPRHAAALEGQRRALAALGR